MLHFVDFAFTLWICPSFHRPSYESTTSRTVSTSESRWWGYSISTVWSYSNQEQEGGNFEEPICTYQGWTVSCNGCFLECLTERVIMSKQRSSQTNTKQAGRKTLFVTLYHRKNKEKIRLRYFQLMPHKCSIITITREKHWNK